MVANLWILREPIGEKGVFPQPASAMGSLISEICDEGQATACENVLYHTLLQKDMGMFRGL